MRLEIRWFLKLLSDMLQPSDKLLFDTRTTPADKHF
jgi:hypothetical protein